jgi:hypothetical protein
VTVTAPAVQLHTRENALTHLVAAIADRTAFVVVPAPTLTVEVATGLAALPAWSAFLDNGGDDVLEMHDATVVAALLVLAGGVCTFVVPRTVPAADLGAVLGQCVPEDGSQDVVFVLDDEARAWWPLLFIDAVDQVDAIAAAQIRAVAVPATVP